MRRACSGLDRSLPAKGKYEHSDSNLRIALYSRGTIARPCSRDGVIVDLLRTTTFERHRCWAAQASAVRASAM